MRRNLKNSILQRTFRVSTNLTYCDVFCKGIHFFLYKQGKTLVIQQNTYC